MMMSVRVDIVSSGVGVGVLSDPMCLRRLS